MTLGNRVVGLSSSPPRTPRTPIARLAAHVLKDRHRLGALEERFLAVELYVAKLERDGRPAVAEGRLEALVGKLLKHVAAVRDGP